MSHFLDEFVTQEDNEWIVQEECPTSTGILWKLLIKH